MRALSLLSLALVSLISIHPLAAGGDGLARQAPKIEIPKPGVSQIMTIEGNFVRVAYNNEGYAILGYRLANYSLGEEWMLIEFGTTLRDGVPFYKLTRDAVSLETPDGKTIPLPTGMEYRAGNTQALQAREKVQRDSINYFPPGASRACRIGFFSDLDDKPMSWDEVELSSAARVSRPTVLQSSGWDPVRPALAEREVCQQCRTCAVQNPDQRGREDAEQELRGYPQAGSGRVQAAEEIVACHGRWQMADGRE